MARPTTRSGSIHLHARKVVPKELRAIIGKTELKAVLRGTTKAERDREHREAMQGFDGQIKTARDTLTGNFKSLTAREAHALARRWYIQRLEDNEPNATTSGAEGWDIIYGVIQDEAAWNPDDGGHPFDTYRPNRKRLADAKVFLTGHGIAADVPSIELMATALWQADLRLADTMRARCRGHHGEDEHLASFPSPTSGGVSAPDLSSGLSRAPFTFTALVDAWAAETQPILKTLEKWRAAFAGFATVIGHDDIGAVTVAEVRAWKEARQAQNRSAKTIGDGIAVMRATTNWGIKNSLVAGPNPFANMSPKVTKRGVTPRVGFTDAEATLILTTARQASGWLRWMPWALAFTGARIEEIAELRKADIRREGGVWVIDIRPNEVRGLKTSQSQQLVPVHPTLEAEGFLKYAADLPAGPLWPDLAPGRYNSRGSTASKNHSRWVRDVVKITSKSIAPAHSWRHRMEDELRRARPVIPDEAIDAITGHDNPRNAGSGYGRGYRGMPDRLAEEIAKVCPPPGLSRV